MKRFYKSQGCLGFFFGKTIPILGLMNISTYANKIISIRNIGKCYSNQYENQRDSKKSG
jgi:hypothetical protein